MTWAERNWNFIEIKGYKMSKLKETKKYIKQLSATDKEELDNLVKRLNNATITYCSQYVNPNIVWILTTDKIRSEYPGSAGSGFIYLYKNKLYFITANHVINDISNTFLLISTTQNINPVFFNELGISRNKPYMPLYSFIDTEHAIIDESRDLYIAPLIYQDLNYINSPTPTEGYFQSFVITGFPVSKNRNYVNESFLSQNDIKIVNINTDYSFASFEGESIFIEYEKNAISVRGCSGSPLMQLEWIINKDENDELYCEIINHNICGVLIEYKNEKIKYLSISVVHELLNKDITKKLPLSCKNKTEKPL